MKRVLKAETEPQTLADYKNRFANAPTLPPWRRFASNASRRQAVVDQLRDDQRGLCAYCEISLIPNDESVEHFVARDADHDRELDWTNLLLCCAGGERPLPEDVADGASRHDPDGPKTCGHAKLGSQDPVLNPLHIPHSPRLFRVKAETGEIEPDIAGCAAAGVCHALAGATVNRLGLVATRLNSARLAVANYFLELLDEAGGAGPLTKAREHELAEEFIPVDGNLPAFFTTIRFVLGEGAEQRLMEIGFEG